MTDVVVTEKAAPEEEGGGGEHEQQKPTAANAAAMSSPSSSSGEEQQAQSPQPEPAAPSSETQQEQQDEKDEEGLLVQRDGGDGGGYDVILCGTSLVQSILASALARAGKKVLHVDAADYYGELDAVWTFPYLLEQEVLLDKQQQQRRVQQQEKDDIDNDDTKKKKSGLSDPMLQRHASSTSAEEYTAVPLSLRGGLEGFQIHSMARKSDDEFEIIDDDEGTCSTIVSTLYGKGRVLSRTMNTTGSSSSSSSSMAIELTGWKLANGHYPILYVGIPSQLQQGNLILHQYLIKECHIIPQAALVAREILDCKSRSLALDITPGLLYAHGPAVLGLLTSQVADYVEFKSLQGLWWYTNSAAAKNNNNNNNAAKGGLEKVPCSKNDVFTSSLLNPMEKRRLMKFLQLALDYATAQEAAAELAAAAAAAAAEKEEDDDDNNNLAIVQSLNERHLNQGRSLARPQNKAVNTSDMETLQECIAQGMDFEAYLRDKHSLSPKLQSLVRYALALEVMGNNNSSSDENVNKPLSVEQGMKRLCRHMQALGRFGSTAFLIPMYGAGELSQAFCRSAAVYGATYILRRAMHGVIVESTTGTSDQGDDDDMQQQQTTGVFISQPPAQDELISSSSSSSTPASPMMSDCKRIPCKHVVIPESALAQYRGTHVLGAPARRRVLRRISIVQGKPKVLLEKQSQEHNDNQCRHAIILPPGSLDTTNNDDKTGRSACPQTYTIQGLVLDESVNVAPHVAPDGCCIVHLSTLVDVDNADANEMTGVTGTQELLLKRALDSIVLDNDAAVHEIFHVSFSFPLHDDLQPHKDNDIRGLHVVRRPPPSLTVDPDFEQAREIVNEICPGADFLTLSKEIETVVKERFGDAGNPHNADDDEKLVLESAMGMIGGNADAATGASEVEPLFIWLGQAQEADGAAKRSRNLLLPVPKPSTPNVTIVENQKEGRDTNEPTTSAQVLALIQKHYSSRGSSCDRRVYFAPSCEGGDVMEHASLIKECIAAAKKAGFSQLSYHVFTSGLVSPPTHVQLADIGVDCFYVSLFAGSKAEYEESSRLEANMGSDQEEEEDTFSKVCDFISTAVDHGIAVEASVLKQYEETGRVHARSLGAREVHVFDQ